MTDDEIIGWHHRFNGHEFEQALGVGDGQGNLRCCSPRGHKELDMTERLHFTSILQKLKTQGTHFPDSLAARVLGEN